MVKDCLAYACAKVKIMNANHEKIKQVPFLLNL
jgi:hypothetical protein